MPRKYPLDGRDRPEISFLEETASPEPCPGYPPFEYAGGYCLFCFPNPPCAPRQYCCPCPFPL
ncbi:MAG: hypothetical protein P4N41_17005 [Negativicutes bacterium]|nr:hypothetical protein [Negativicutes bacterium]